MTKITLNKVKRRGRTDRRVRAVWMLRWYGTDGKRYGETIGECKKLTKRDAEAIRRSKQSKLDCNIVRPDRPKKINLGVFLAHYQEQRRQGNTGRGFMRGAPKLSDATITAHTMTLRYLIKHFREDRAIGSISVADADAVVTAIAAGRLAGARKKSKRVYGMSQENVRGHIRNAKAIFNWAKRFGLVTTNPFDNFDGTSLPSKPNHYIPMEDFEKLVEAAPSPDWKAMYALCRLAGLRRGEALEIPWSGKATDTEGEEHFVGIDWERRRLHVMGNAKTRLKHRQLPMSPRLHDILLDAFNSAPEGQVAVTGLSANNLTRLAKDHIASAGLKLWPKIYQAMRSSCENDWKQKNVAEATYAAWIGHSPNVSRKHYVAPTDAEFDAIIG